MKYLLLFLINLNSVFLFVTKNYFCKSIFDNKLVRSYNSIQLNEQYINQNDNNDEKFYRFGINPRLDELNNNGELTWYVIGTSCDFQINKPTVITIRDINYMVWRDSNSYYAIRDACSHQGSSFQNGCIYQNSITCPYHGYTFNGINGQLTDIPKLQFMDSENHNIDAYKIIEKFGFVYMNTVPIKNNNNLINETSIWIEPEAYNKNQKGVILSENFEHYAKFISVNSLDICHIGFVHTFGNNKNPNPINSTRVIKMNDSNYHYKIIYEYLAGPKSLVNKIYNFNKITVENEYILPHTTVARVLFGNFSSTIITHALPISKFKTKLYVKAYRNYWYTNTKNSDIFSVFFNSVINNIGDIITYNTMFNTLKQDKAIVDNIDKTNYSLMHGKFSILYDMLSNHYKNNYKKYYEFDKFNF
jgi:phenylpropionate dioxygenase-like ring-hydroxylating dioxygenase large terminal subunit